MSRFFDDLERQLHAAASARSRPAAGPADAEAPRRRGWLRRGLRGAPAAVAVAVTLAVVVGALLLLAHRPRPAAPATASSPLSGLGAILTRTPHARLMRELAFIRAATQGVQRSPACRLRNQFAVSYIHGSPGSDLLSILGVLRRPATPADRLRSSALGSGADIYAGYVRRAAVLDGVGYYIVPTRYERSRWLPSDRC
ncbi:MAG TPA: hypothetical protein VFN87_00195, partial [Solirubrobacteraceae bacterium]|nr:hypothetical protein [Solirubrobacteraceae bacterium]